MSDTDGCVMVSGTTEHPDWSFAQRELLDKQGIDLRKEMEARYTNMSQIATVCCSFIN